MLRRGLAVATLAIAGCHDAPARTAPRPTAPVQASRALLEQALTTALADADKARTLAPPPPPAPPDDPAAFADLLTNDPDATGAVGSLGRFADPDDPDSAGGVVGGVVGGQLGGIVGGQLGQPPPPLPSVIVVQLLSASQGLDADTVRLNAAMLRIRAINCQRAATDDGTLTDAVTATVSLSAVGADRLAVHVSDAGPLSTCLEERPLNMGMADGSTLTFEVRIRRP